MLKIKLKIVIDPGHGGRDPGAVDDIEGNDKFYTEESNINLIIANKVYNILVQLGYDVIMTRTNDETISIQERCDIANNSNADILVSIHNNAANDEDAEGSEFLYWPGNIEGKSLAKSIENNFIKNINRVNRGIKPCRELYLLENTSLPSVIVEAAFITNPVEEKLLHSDYFRSLIAISIANGIDAYFDALISTFDDELGRD